MAFDISTARPYEEENTGFDITTAKPYQETQIAQSVQPQETGFLEDVGTAVKERWNEFTNPKPSYLGTNLGGVGRIVSPLTSPEMVNAGASLGGLAYDVIGAGLKQGLRAAKSFDEAPNQVDQEWEAIKPYVSKGVEYAKDAWGGVEKFSPTLAADAKRLVDLTGLGTVKTIAGGVGKILPSSGLSTEAQLTKGIGQDIVKGTRKSGIIPTVSRGYEDIKSFQNAAKDVMPDIVKNKKSLSFLDEKGALQQGIRPETVEELSQVIKPRKDAIMAEITSGLEKAGAEGATISPNAELRAINELENLPAYKAMLKNKEYDDVIAKLQDRKERTINAGNVTPAEYNAEITILNDLVSKKADTLSDVLYIHLLKAKRAELAKFMDSLGGQFQEQKSLWGKYHELEPKIAQRANQLSREPSGMGYWNMPALAEAFAGVATGHPGLVGAAAATKLTGSAYQYLKSPNRQIDKMFKRIEKKMGQIPSKPPINPLEGDISGVRPTPLGLPMPERGFTLQGEPYGEVLHPSRLNPMNKPVESIVPEFTATSRGQIRGFDQPLQLPPGGQFTTGQVVPNISTSKLKRIWEETPEEVYLKGLRDTKRKFK